MLGNSYFLFTQYASAPCLHAANGASEATNDEHVARTGNYVLHILDVLFQLVACIDTLPS